VRTDRLSSWEQQQERCFPCTWCLLPSSLLQYQWQGNTEQSARNFRFSARCAFLSIYVSLRGWMERKKVGGGGTLSKRRYNRVKPVVRSRRLWVGITLRASAGGGHRVIVISLHPMLSLSSRYCWVCSLLRVVAVYVMVCPGHIYSWARGKTTGVQVNWAPIHAYSVGLFVPEIFLSFTSRGLQVVCTLPNPAVSLYTA
jgi:hypothetical protein